MIFINQNSFTIAAGALLLVLLAFLRRGGLDLGKALALAALLLGLSLTYFLFSPGRSATARADQVAQIVGGGKPVLLEFQSPY